MGVENSGKPRHSECAVCSSLGDREAATEKAGSEALSTRLPDATAELMLAKDLRPKEFRKLQLWRCPACLTYYLYRTDYEYLAGGTEDEEYLTRLTDAQAAEYLEQT